MRISDWRSDVCSSDLHGLVDLRRLAQHEAQSPAAGRYVADVDAPALALPQFGPDALLDHLKPLLCDVAGVGFQQDVAAAAQVEAEVYLFARHESGPFRNHFLREEVGNCEHQSDKDGKEYPPVLPGRKVEHGLTTGLIVGRARSDEHTSDSSD